MNITLYTDEKKINNEYKFAIDEYVKRLSPFCKINLKYNIKQIDFAKKSYKFWVDDGDKTITSETFAKKFVDITNNGNSDIDFYCFDKNIRAKLMNENYEQFVNEFEVLALTTLDLSNDVALSVLLEQIYRAFTINNNIKYHK